MGWGIHACTCESEDYALSRVRPTMQLKDSVPVNDDAALEHEADVMGAKASG